MSWRIVECAGWRTSDSASVIARVVAVQRVTAISGDVDTADPHTAVTLPAVAEQNGKGNQHNDREQKSVHGVLSQKKEQ